MKNNNKPKIGLALGSGGTRGLTIIGVLKVLKKYEIDIDYIAGSSIGAIIGGAYAIEKDIDKIEKIALTLQYKEIVNSLADLGRMDGFIRGDKLVGKIKSYIGERKIEDLEIPFAAVATDKDTGDPVTLDHGDLASAMRASSSIPIVFESFEGLNNKLLDGGVSQQVPVEIVKKMGADVVTAVNLTDDILKYESKSKISTIRHYVLLLLRNLATENCRNADVFISPKFNSISWLKNLKNREDLIAEGERATEEKIDQILKKINL